MPISVTRKYGLDQYHCTDVMRGDGERYMLAMSSTHPQEQPRLVRCTKKQFQKWMLEAPHQIVDIKIERPL